MFDIDLHGDHPGGEQLVTEDGADVRVGQLWRRKRDGKAFIPASRVTDGWLDKAGIKRTAAELGDGYVLVQPTDGTPAPSSSIPLSDGRSETR